MYLLKTKIEYSSYTKFFYLKDALEYGYKTKLDFIIFKKDKIVADIKFNKDGDWYGVFIRDYFSFCSIWCTTTYRKSWAKNF